MILGNVAALSEPAVPKFVPRRFDVVEGKAPVHCSVPPCCAMAALERKSDRGQRTGTNFFMNLVGPSSARIRPSVIFGPSILQFSSSILRRYDSEGPYKAHARRQYSKSSVESAIAKAMLTSFMYSSPARISDGA